MLYIMIVICYFFPLQDCFPMRFKGVHYLNEPIIFDGIFAIVRPFMKEKILQRVSSSSVFEPRHVETGFLHMQKQERRSASRDQRLCFRYIVQFLYLLNPKFQATSDLLWLPSPVCVGTGRKPRRQVFSQRGSFINF